MSLPVLAMVVVVGLALIIGVVYLTGGSSSASLLTEQKARDWFNADLPNEVVVEVLLSDNEQSALLTLADPGKVGLIKTMGNMSVTRLVDGNSLKQITIVDDRLLLKLRDFTLRNVELKISDEQSRNKAIERLHNLKEIV